MPILLITAVGAFLRFYAIGRQGFWYDESYTVLLVHSGPGEMLRLIPQLESTPPLYYSVAWVWARIFGFDEAGLKSLSALCGTITIPVAYLAARKLLANWRSAVIVAALVAFNPLLIWYSQEARAYSMLVLLSACTLLAFAYVLERPRPAAVAMWALACALALLTHYYAAIIVVPEIAWLLYEHRHSRALKVGIGAIVLVVAGLAPLAIRQSSNRSNKWIMHSSYLLRLRQFPALFLIGPETHLREVVKFVAFAMVAVGVVLLITRSRRRERQGALLPGALALGGFVLSAVVGHNTFLARNLLPVWLPAAMFIAGGFGAARAKLVGIAATVVLCAIGAFAVVSVDATPAFQRPNWKLVANAIGRWPEAGYSSRDARIILIQDNPGLLPLGLYLKDLRYIESPTLQRVVAIDVIAVLPHKGLGGFCWWGSECNLIPSHLNRRYFIPGFHVVAIRRIHDFGIVELRSSRPRDLPRTALPTVREQELEARREIRERLLYLRRHHRLHKHRHRSGPHQHLTRLTNRPVHDAQLIEQS